MNTNSGKSRGIWRVRRVRVCSHACARTNVRTHASSADLASKLMGAHTDLLCFLLQTPLHVRPQ